MRRSEVKCDWCEEALPDVWDDDFPIEHGWIEAVRCDIMGEVVHLDFCTEECVVRYFSKEA